MRNQQIPLATIEECRRLLDQPDNLIAFAFFVHEEGKVVLVGDVAGCGAFAQGDNLYEAIETFGTVANCLDERVEDQFGPVVTGSSADNPELSKAAESLRQSLLTNPGVVSVRNLSSIIIVLLSKEGVYEGPWSWLGYPVYTEVKEDSL